MFPQILIKHNIGNTITIPNQLDIKVGTFMSTNALSGVTSLSVDNTAGFTTGSTILLLLSSLANQNAEIVTSTAHTTTAFTVGTTTQNHQRGEQIQELKWDKIVIYKSATLTGVYSQLGTDVPFQVTQMNTIVNDTAGLTTDYYKVQWKNSVSGLVSDFSEPISVEAYLPTSAGALLKSVSILFGIDENDTNINATFLLEALNDARQYTESKLYGIRHAWRQEFEFPIKVLAGKSYVELPDDIDFNETDQSLLAARFKINNAIQPYNLRYIDKRAWNQIAFYSTGSETLTATSIGGTTISLKSVGDFATTGGSAVVATNDYTEDVITIEYTGIDYTTNTLTGVTGVTRTLPIGTQIWVITSMNQPIWYSVWDNRIYFSSLIPQMMQGNNLYIDYYKKMVKIDNLYDVIPEHYREMYKSYVRWAIKYRKDITLPTTDPDLVKFEGQVEALFNNLYTGQESTIITS